ncbi:Gag-like protein [Operophtera brumata]|uniref:Gag-like protein n=1 Tax=Operophtera brumata TaxID=104452 RepID=A0A0L7LR09_OPEBR|nr:Gag-like protein [Operophtera brumata]
MVKNVDMMMPSPPSPTPSAAAPKRARRSPTRPFSIGGPEELPPHSLPNWTVHFAAIRAKLGHAPNARPLSKGVRFTPRSPEEYRIVQRHLVDASAENPAITWFTYSVVAVLPTKVAIRGLPAVTPPEEIKAALYERDFQPKFVKHIRTKQGRAGCLFHTQ